jgi:hypothetical protein
MSIDWDRLDQSGFDRIVEVLVYRRFQDKVRAVNGPYRRRREQRDTRVSAPQVVGGQS